MTRACALTLGALLWLSTGCAYHNVLYNSERLFTEAEARRRGGDPELARLAYLDVVRKTGDALRARPQSDWAADALFLLGRSRLRLGELREALGALREAVARRSAIGPRGDELVYLAIVQSRLGDDDSAMELVGRALGQSLAPASRADGLLLRGRLRLARGLTDEGWADLDRSVEADPTIDVEAGLERLRWAILGGDRARATFAVSELLGEPAAAAHVDTLIALTRSAIPRWGDAGAAELLVDVERATWDRAARGHAALERARRLDAAGEHGQALREAARVAAGLGPAAAEARLLLSSWQLASARELADVYGVRGILLPSGADSAVAERLEALDRLQAYADVGLADPLGWFAAGEIARDSLGADYVARGLFLAYCDQAPGEAWAPKALLAALDMSPDIGDRAWLRGRLEAYRESPYVLAARGRPAAGFLELEEELALRLKALERR